MGRLRSTHTVWTGVGLALLLASCGTQSGPQGLSARVGATSAVPSYGTAKPISTDTWEVPVAKIRRLGTADPRLALLRGTLDQMATNTVLIKVERYGEPVDYSNSISLRSNAEAPKARADTFITISDANSGLAAWEPTDYSKVEDLLALLPTLGSRKSSATP